MLLPVHCHTLAKHINKKRAPMGFKNAHVDAITEAQWMGAFACKFVPHEATRLEYQLNVARKFHCKIPRLSYLPLITPAVVEHYFERPEEVANLRISYELVVPSQTSSSGGDGGEQAVWAPEYYPLGVLVDSLCNHDYGVVTFSFRVTGGAPDSNVLALPIGTSDKGLFLNLHQQQKATCVSLFGSNQAMMKLEPQLMNQLDDAVRQNDCRAFYHPRNIVFQSGSQDSLRSSISSAALVGDMATFMIHKDGLHTMRLVSIRSAPTLGLVLKCCLQCFEGLDVDGIDNQPADSQKYAAVLLTGVEPALSTPTEFLRDNLACADFAIHLTVQQAATSTLPRGLFPQVDWKALSRNASMSSPLL